MEISENTLIKRLKVFEKRNKAVVRGIGDDGAVVDLAAGRYVFVQDTMTEHVHFELSFLSPYHLGKKALTVNISDILAMGAKPLFFLVTIGVPDRLVARDIEMLYRGMAAAAKAFGVTLLGGDTSASDVLYVDISVTGRLVGDRYLGRNHARTGDLIAVTGRLGEAAYGLRLLMAGDRHKGSAAFIRRFIDPQLPYTIWQELIKRDITHAMMDISDGLIIDLERMMKESSAGARLNLEKIPVPSLLKKMGLEELALAGGEDYQLLFTFPSGKLADVEAMKEMGHEIFVIGEVTKGRGVKLYREGKKMGFKTKGYEHFGGGR